MLWNRPGSKTPRTASSRGLSGFVIGLPGVRSFTVLGRSWRPAHLRSSHRYDNGVSEGTRQSQGPVSTDEGFSATVAAITSAFGDNTRRQIYLFAGNARA